ncbi:MAG: glycosyltransferase, partial [Candidatus Sericytochromatia bacterium]
MDAIGLDAGQPAAYHLLGEVLEAIGQPGYAERAFAQVLQLDPDHPDALDRRLTCRRQEPVAPLAEAEAAVLEGLLTPRTPTLSACLIVKDEAGNLPGCLASLQGWVDEIVVMDTGSTDETVAIAESFGAKVGHFTWCDDFSAARNASLELATSDWILVIDADEQLQVDDSTSLRRLLLGREPAAYNVQLGNLDEAGHVGQWAPLLRLFQRREELRFEGRLHEAIIPGVTALGWPVADATGVRLLHSGYRADVIAERGKVERNLRLAEAQVNEQPDAPQAWLNLARSLMVAGRHAEALGALERLAGIPAALPLAAFSDHVSCRAVALEALGRFAEAAAALTEGLARLPGFPGFLYERGRLRAHLGDGVGARADFEACLAADGRSFPVAMRAGLTDAMPRRALAGLPAPQPAPGPTVTACLIVKNEAGNLPGCLASLNGWVDEIVVVDTGSTD